MGNFDFKNNNQKFLRTILNNFLLEKRNLFMNIFFQLSGYVQRLLIIFNVRKTSFFLASQLIVSLT